jgi:hypothetical protein
VTEPLEPHGITRECLHCGTEFTPRKAGHVFHTIECRHRVERRPDERKPIDVDAIERLFDESRDAGERVRDDDWFPESGAAAKHLYTFDTVGGRRRWYLNLKAMGRL